jgi:hypothetical protein
VVDGRGDRIAEEHRPSIYGSSLTFTWTPHRISPDESSLVLTRFCRYHALYRQCIMMLPSYPFERSWIPVAHTGFILPRHYGKVLVMGWVGRCSLFV